MQRQIDYYFSLQSPWAYIGHCVLCRVVSDYNCKVNYKPVQLLDLFSETGGRVSVTRPMELPRWRDKRGLSFHISRPIGRTV
jgi:2-hydroxychromene-2-carboxylate isomerase